MKNLIAFVFCCLLSMSSYAQDSRFEVRGMFTHSVTKDKLKAARSMCDIVAGYPSSWITDYISVAISAVIDGNTVKAVGMNEVLNKGQLKMLAEADLGTDVVLDISYKSKNIITGNDEISIMNFTTTIVPEIQAEYQGGPEEMTHYFQQNAIDKIYFKYSSLQVRGEVKFTITEDGEISNPYVVKTSGDSEIDTLLLETILKMPKWRPAQDANGVKVKQDFVLSVGNTGC